MTQLDLLLDILPRDQLKPIVAFKNQIYKEKYISRNKNMEYDNCFGF